MDVITSTELQLLHKPLTGFDRSTFYAISCFMREVVSGRDVTFISGQIVTTLEHAPQSLFCYVTFKYLPSNKTIEDGIGDTLVVVIMLVIICLNTILYIEDF